MKIRIGFVSNSSSSSFCIFGWSSNDIKAIGFDDYFDFMKAVTEKCGLHLTSSYYEGSGEHIVGLGNTDEEFDHYMEDWMSYECDPPTVEEQILIHEIGMVFKLPKPGMYADTWFNG